jgi:hypothetical protein
VNLHGGRTRDGGSIVGASVFYTTSRSEGEEKGEGEMPEKTTCTEVDKLDRELKVFALDMVLLHSHPENGGSMFLQNMAPSYQTPYYHNFSSVTALSYHLLNLSRLV